MLPPTLCAAASAGREGNFVWASSGPVWSEFHRDSTPTDTARQNRNQSTVNNRYAMSQLQATNRDRSRGTGLRFLNLLWGHAASQIFPIGDDEYILLGPDSQG